MLSLLLLLLRLQHRCDWVEPRLLHLLAGLLEERLRQCINVFSGAQPAYGRAGSGEGRQQPLRAPVIARLHGKKHSRNDVCQHKQEDTSAAHPRSHTPCCKHTVRCWLSCPNNHTLTAVPSVRAVLSDESNGSSIPAM